MRKRILLVDDTHTVTALEKLILGNGYDYLEARDGSQAFELARELGPDVILMDVNMPGTDGIQALGILKAEPRTANIPVVMVSTRSEAARIEACRLLGCVEFVTKPIDHDLLRSTVKRIVGDLA